MPPTPDIAGYEAALQRKREALGEDVVFHFAETDAYPEGTVLDPQTGKPYDPLIEPSKAETPTPVTINCSVAFRPSFQEDTDETQIGNIKMNVALVWVSLGAEWESIQAAVSFDVKGDNYLIRKTTEDGIGGNFRMLIWGERQGAAA